MLGSEEHLSPDENVLDSRTYKRETPTWLQCSHQKLLTRAPHVVHALEHLPVFQKGKQADVVGALADRVEAPRRFLRAKIPFQYPNRYIPGHNA